MFEGGEFEWRTWAARSVTRASSRCIRCCKKSLDPGFAVRDLLLSLASPFHWKSECTVDLRVVQ